MGAAIIRGRRRSRQRRDVHGHQGRRVQAQARVDIRRAPRGDQLARPGRVLLEAAHVRGVAARRLGGVARGLGERGRRHRARMRSTRSPPHVQSSSDVAPCEPAHRMATSRPAPTAHGAAAVTLTSAATPIASAARAARRVRVPLLVVKKTVMPRTRAALELDGRVAEIESGNRLALPLAGQRARRRSPSPGAPPGVVRIGDRHDRAQPFASAVMIVVEARSTSITRAVTPASSAGTTASGGRRDVDRARVRRCGRGARGS